MRGNLRYLIPYGVVKVKMSGSNCVTSLLNSGDILRNWPVLDLFKDKFPFSLWALSFRFVQKQSGFYLLGRTNRTRHFVFFHSQRDQVQNYTDQKAGAKLTLIRQSREVMGEGK